MIQKVIPVLPSLNIKQTILFYESILGFKAINQGGYVVMKKGEIEIHFFLCTNKEICENTSCYIKVNDVQCLYSELAAQDLILPKNKLKDLPRGKKFFSIKDNNGNKLQFVEET
jgi:hypothetical protein